MKGYKKLNSFLLALFTLTFALASIKIVLQEQIPGFNQYFPVPLLFQFAWGPLLYLYLKSSAIAGFKLTARHLVHFLPSLLFDVVLASVFIYAEPSFMPQVAKLRFLTNVVAFIFFSGYVVRSFRFVSTYKNSITTTGGNHKTSIRWFYKIVIGCATIAASWLVFIVLVFAGNGGWFFNLAPYYVFFFFIGLGMYSISLHGYYHPEIGLITIPPVPEKKELLAAEVLEEKKQLLLELVKHNHYYRDESLSLQNLADKVNMTSRDLSYVINTGFKMNFNDFINEFRVHEFLQRLQGPEGKKFSVEGMAYEVGFNSKASFYRAFKKVTNKTPGDYLKENVKSV